MEEDTARLFYQGLYDWPATLAFLENRSIDGVEQVEAGVYRRTIRWDGLTGTLEVGHDRVGSALIATVRLLPPDATRLALERVTHMFDLAADLQTITAHLSRDPYMAPLVAARPALRVLRGWDRFEVAVRSIIGQQVTVARARLLNGILVERCGSWLRHGIHQPGRVFPTPQQVLDADLATMGMPGARVRALKSVASAVLADPQLFDRASSVDETTARLRAVRGIGDWTAHYIAMRACGEPDAFPASDVGLLRAAADPAGRRPSPDELLARAEPWRPWRAYAAHQLWAVDGARALDSTARDGVSAGSRSVIVTK